MWDNFVWLCKGTSDDGQLQAATVLIQVSLQKYYLLLIFCQYNRCRKLVLSKSSRVYLKKSLHSRDSDIFIFTFAVTIYKPSIFFLDPVPRLAVKTNTSTYIKSESSRHIMKGTSSLGIIVRCRWEALEDWSENTSLYNASDLRKSNVWLKVYRLTHLMPWEEQHRD
jgi:hypothetical protein